MTKLVPKGRCRFGLSNVVAKSNLGLGLQSWPKLSGTNTPAPHLNVGLEGERKLSAKEESAPFESFRFLNIEQGVEGKVGKCPNNFGQDCKFNERVADVTPVKVTPV